MFIKPFYGSMDFSQSSSSANLEVCAWRDIILSGHIVFDDSIPLPTMISIIQQFFFRGCNDKYGYFQPAGEFNRMAIGDFR